jgi:outer membrane protein assembly factor BamB
MKRFALTLVSLFALLFPARAFAQAAHVYVQTAKGVNLYDASSAGKLSLVSGSPFQTTGLMIGSNGTHFITLGTDDVHTYSLAANGAIKEQVSEIDTQSHSGAACGTAAGAVLDHTGEYLYVTLQGPYGVARTCDAFQTYSIAKTTGELTFKGAVPFGSTQQGVSFAALPTFSGNGAFAYEILCCEYPDESFLTGFSRDSSGALTTIGTLLPNGDPAAQAGMTYQPIPTSLAGQFSTNPVSATNIAADATNHLAVILCPVQNWPNGCSDGPVVNQLASYTIGGDGQLATTNTWENMPTLTITSESCDDGCQPIEMAMSPSGKILAVSVETGVQFFHFNAADPITAFTGIIGISGYISSMRWDSSNHLYAINGASGKLHVYTATTTSVVEAPGSPYAIGAKGLAVVPE